MPCKIKNFLVFNWKKILFVMFSPLIAYFFNVLIVSIFNTGTYVGNFLRYLYLYFVT